VRANARLWFQFYQREISNRYLGSLSGLLWVFIHPALLLLLYTFLVAGIFKARIPGLNSDQILPYVALGLWPWMCFSEGLQRGAQAVLDHAGLLGKVALPAELLVAASVAATFSLHSIGMIAATLILWLLGFPLAIGYIWALPLLLACLFGFTLGCALVAASVQVYVRDLAQVLGQGLGFVFFLTPILYTAAMLPEAVRPWLVLNPISIYCNTARDFLLLHQASFSSGHVIALVIAVLALTLGWLIFKRLARHFEDFL
jgi:lipopolysaccharide transport system permease protein